MQETMQMIVMQNVILKQIIHKFMRKKNLIYIPLVLILIIQFFDKKDQYTWAQYLLLSIMILALVINLLSKRIEDN